MKNIKRKFMALVLVLCTTICMAQVVLAEDDFNCQQILEIDPQFVEDYSNLFEHPDIYTVLDQDNDVTVAFVEQYSDAYQHNDFATIWTAVYENDYTLSWVELPETSPAAFLSLSATHRFTRLVDLSDLVSGKTVYVSALLTGTYTVNDSTGLIYSCETPVFNGIECTPGSLFVVTAKDVQTLPATLSADKTKVTFSAKYSIHATYGGYNTGITIKETDKGPYTIKFSVDASNNQEEL